MFCETSHVCIAVHAEKRGNRSIARILDWWPDAYAPFAQSLGVPHEGFATTFAGYVSDKDMWGASHGRGVPRCYREADELARLLNAETAGSDLFAGYPRSCDALVVNALGVPHEPMGHSSSSWIRPMRWRARSPAWRIRPWWTSCNAMGGAFTCLGKVAQQFDRLRTVDGPHAGGLIDTFGALAMLFAQGGMVEEAHVMRLSTIDEVNKRADEGAWLERVAPHLAWMVLDPEADAVGCVTSGVPMRLAERMATLACFEGPCPARPSNMPKASWRPSGWRSSAWTTRGLCCVSAGR